MKTGYTSGRVEVRVLGGMTVVQVAGTRARKTFVNTPTEAQLERAIEQVAADADIETLGNYHS